MQARIKLKEYLDLCESKVRYDVLPSTYWHLHDRMARIAATASIKCLYYFNTSGATQLFHSPAFVECPGWSRSPIDEEGKQIGPWERYDPERTAEL